MTIGFLGTGNITSALVTGLCTTAAPPERILLSPRNAERAEALAERFPNVVVAADNQAVLDGSECVVIALRPQVAAEALQPLRFRAEHFIVSLVATFGGEAVRRLVAPATHIVRAVPLPCAARHVGPIAYTPQDAEFAAWFGSIGELVAVDDDHTFQTLWAVTSLIAPFYTFVDAAARWAAKEGVPQDAAERYAAAMFHGLALPLGEAWASPAELAEEAQTPGGLNEQVVRELTQAGTYAALAVALDRILARLEGR